MLLRIKFYEIKDWNWQYLPEHWLSKNHTWKCSRLCSTIHKTICFGLGWKSAFSKRGFNKGRGVWIYGYDCTRKVWWLWIRLSWICCCYWRNFKSWPFNWVIYSSSQFSLYKPFVKIWERRSNKKMASWSCHRQKSWCLGTNRTKHWLRCK